MEKELTEKEFNEKLERDAKFLGEKFGKIKDCWIFSIPNVNETKNNNIIGIKNFNTIKISIICFIVWLIIGWLTIGNLYNKKVLIEQEKVNKYESSDLFNLGRDLNEYKITKFKGYNLQKKIENTQFKINTLIENYLANNSEKDE